jgi:2-polyprenyl-3-methyl-5-hydroxy-6-metoxy-1,4-benzoquinol methylase
MAVTMSYAGATVDSPARLKRFSHRRRFNIAVRLVRALPGETVFDVGTGDGYFPVHLVAARPGVQVLAYDPVPTQAEQARERCRPFPEITVVDRIDATPDAAWATCFETLEHMDEWRQRETLTLMRDAVAPHGRMVISVPLEVGLPGALKTAARWALGQQHGGSWREHLRAIVGRPVSRDFRDGYAHYHTGFDHRKLRRLIRWSGFRVLQTVYSPVPFAGRMLNSQVFWVLQPR